MFKAIFTAGHCYNCSVLLLCIVSNKICCAWFKIWTLSRHFIFDKVLDIYWDLGKYLWIRDHCMRTSWLMDFPFFLFCLLFGEWDGLGIKVKVRLPQSKALSKHELLSQQFQLGQLRGDGYQRHTSGGSFLGRSAWHLFSGESPDKTGCLVGGQRRIHLSQSHTQDPGSQDILFFQVHPWTTSPSWGVAGGGRKWGIKAPMFRGPNLRRCVGVVVGCTHWVHLQIAQKESASAPHCRAQKNGTHTLKETSVFTSSNSSCFLAPDLVRYCRLKQNQCGEDPAKPWPCWPVWPQQKRQEAEMSERTEKKFILSFLYLAPVHVSMLSEYTSTHS